MENFVEPIDGRDISKEIDSNSHGHSGIFALVVHSDTRVSDHSFVNIGPLRASVPMYPVSTDSRVLNTTSQLSSEFPFNHDYNSISGNTLGVSK